MKSQLIKLYESYKSENDDITRQLYKVRRELSGEPSNQRLKQMQDYYVGKSIILNKVLTDLEAVLGETAEAIYA